MTLEYSQQSRTYKWWHDGGEVYSYNNPPWNQAQIPVSETNNGPSCILWRYDDPISEGGGGTGYRIGWQAHRCQRTDYKKCLCEAADDIPLP